MKPTKVTKPFKAPMLPGRPALKKLTRGAPGDGTLIDFGEATPVGRNAPQTYPGIIAMGKKGAKIA